MTHVQIMIYAENPLTGDWLCHIPKTSHAYYCPTKKSAQEFCDAMNAAFACGKLTLDKDGHVKINDNNENKIDHDVPTTTNGVLRTG
jgi:hypothetical protein